MSAQMNGHSAAVVKAQLSSRHTFSGKNNRTEITSPSQPANRTPAPESALPFNGRFLKRSAFWKPSATLPVFWRPWPPFPVSFPARTFRRKPSPEPMPVFFSFSFYLFSLHYKRLFPKSPSILSSMNTVKNLKYPLYVYSSFIALGITEQKTVQYTFRSNLILKKK